MKGGVVMRDEGVCHGNPLTLLWLGFSMDVKGLGGVKLPPLSKILLKHAMTPLFGMLIKEPMYFQKIYTLTPL